MSQKQKQTKTRAKSAPPSKFTEVLRSPMTWLVALVVVAGTITVALAAADSSDDTTDPSAAQTAPVEIDGTPLPPFARPDAAIGTAVPTVSATTLSGDDVTLRADGTARLFGFFAHWCPHCQDELPATAQWLDTNDLPSNVEVIAVSTAVNPTAENYPPSDWFERENWPATVLVDSPENAIANGMGLTAFPYWVAVDGDGDVVARLTGQIDETQFALLVETLGNS